MNSSRNNNTTTATATQRRRTSVAIIAFVASITASGIIILHMRASCNLDNYLKNDRHDLFIAPENMLVGAGAADTKESMIAPLDIDNICPRSSAINTMNNNTPPLELMPRDELLRIVKYWRELNCPQRDTCKFASIGQHLLHIAMERNQTLLTVQVGAMDGRSNDPMYNMFVETRGFNYVLSRRPRWGELPPGKDSPFPDLRNWLPVMIEPVLQNYDDMKQTYLVIANDRGLGCAVPIHAAVSYEDSNKTSCSFCRFNTADDAPATCKGK